MINDSRQTFIQYNFIQYSGRRSAKKPPVNKLQQVPGARINSMLVGVPLLSPTGSKVCQELLKSHFREHSEADQAPGTVFSKDQKDIRPLPKLASGREVIEDSAHRTPTSCGVYSNVHEDSSTRKTFGSSHKCSAEVEFPKRSILEIGFGGGEHILEIARANPDSQILASECFANGIMNLIINLENLSLTNVRIFPDDIRYLLPSLSANTFTKIYILFPDPWPKRRQQKRRLVNLDFLAQLQNLLLPGGEIWFASDDHSYYSAVTHYANILAEQFTVSSAFSLENKGFFHTRYEEKALTKGRSCHYICLQKNILSLTR